MGKLPFSERPVVGRDRFWEAFREEHGQGCLGREQVFGNADFVLQWIRSVLPLIFCGPEYLFRHFAIVSAIRIAEDQSLPLGQPGIVLALPDSERGSGAGRRWVIGGEVSLLMEMCPCGW